MTLTGWVISAIVAAYALKLSGYLLPRRVLERASVIEVASAVTVGLLASLVALNTLASGRQLTPDSRLLALLVAAVALKLRAPYLVVVVAGALAAALGRLAGLP